MGTKYLRTKIVNKLVRSFQVRREHVFLQTGEKSRRSKICTDFVGWPWRTAIYQNGAISVHEEHYILPVSIHLENLNNLKFVKKSDIS